jgi:carbon storage regulator CsrA
VLVIASLVSPTAWVAHRLLNEPTTISLFPFLTEEKVMLVLSRKVGEELVIGDNIRIVISRVAGNRVSVAIQAPADVPIVRGELKVFRDEFAENDELHAESLAPRCAR